MNIRHIPNLPIIYTIKNQYWYNYKNDSIYNSIHNLTLVHLSVSLLICLLVLKFRFRKRRSVSSSSIGLHLGPSLILSTLIIFCLFLHASKSWSICWFICCFTHQFKYFPLRLFFRWFINRFLFWFFTLWSICWYICWLNFRYVRWYTSWLKFKSASSGSANITFLFQHLFSSRQYKPYNICMKQWLMQLLSCIKRYVLFSFFVPSIFGGIIIITSKAAIQVFVCITMIIFQQYFLM